MCINKIPGGPLESGSGGWCYIYIIYIPTVPYCIIYYTYTADGRWQTVLILYNTVAHTATAMRVPVTAIGKLPTIGIGKFPAAFGR